MTADMALAVLAGVGVACLTVLLGLWVVTMYQTLSSWTRYKQAERAAKREDERRINGTANDFDPLARHLPRKPYTRESGPQ